MGYADDLNLYQYVGNDPLNRTDPTGRCPNCVTGGIGFVLGGLGGGAIEIGAQLITTGQVGDWNAVGGATAGGAVAGGVTGFTGNPVLGGAAGGAVQSGVTSLLNDPGDVGGAARSAVVGGALGAATGGAAQRLSASGRGALGTNWVARNERFANMQMGRIQAGQVNPLNQRATTWGRLGAATVTQSVAPTALGSGAERMISTAVENNSPSPPPPPPSPADDQRTRPGGRYH